MPLKRIRCLANVIVPDANVINHPAKEVIRSQLASVKKNSILRRGVSFAADSPSRALASATRKMSLAQPHAINTICASPIRKSRMNPTSSMLSHAAKIGSRLHPSPHASRPLPSPISGVPTNQLRPMATLLREGARSQVAPLDRVPTIHRATIKERRQRPVLQPIPREVMYAAGARMADRRL